MAERNGNKSIDLPSDPSFVISGDASDQRRRKDFRLDSISNDGRKDRKRSASADSLLPGSILLKGSIRLL